MDTPAWDIYARQLMNKRYGYPLFQPDYPPDNGGIRFGDVGFIDSGAFHPCFNVIDEAHPLNKKLPKDFDVKKFHFPALVFARYKGFLQPDLYRSESVVEVMAEGEVDAMISGGSIDIKYSRQEAACLLLKDEGVREGLVNNCFLPKTYAGENDQEWLKYFETSLGCDVRKNGIIFVTGVIKTTAWGLAAFSGGSVHGGVSFKMPTGFGVSAGGGVSIGKSGRSSAITRVGPMLTHIVQNEQGGSSPDGQSKECGAPLPADQTVFIQCLKVKPRLLGIWRRIAAAGRENPDPDPFGEDTGPEITAIPSNDECHDALDDLTDYILAHSDADVAIAGTDDLLELCSDEWPVDIRAFLEQRQPTIENINGHAFLSLEDIIVRRNSQKYDNNVPRNNSATGEKSQQDKDDTLDASKLQDLFSASLYLARRRQMNPPDISWPHRVLLEDTQGGAVTAMTVSPDGKYVASCFEDGIIRIWPLDSPKLSAKLGRQDELFSCIVWSPDSSCVLAGSMSQVFLWDIHRENEPQMVFQGHEEDVQAVTISPDGTLAATGSIDGNIILWDVNTGETRIKLPDNGGMVLCTTFSPNGELLAAAVDSMAYVWNTSTGERICDIQGHDGVIWFLTFAPNSERIITGAEDHTARVWDVTNGDELVVINEHSGAVWSAVFSADGAEILTGSDDGVVSACNSYTGENRLSLSLNERPSVVNVAAYSPDGEHVVAGCADGSLRIWEARSGKHIVEIVGHKDKVKNVGFTPDSRNIVSSSDDGTVRVWDVVDILRVA